MKSRDDRYFLALDSDVWSVREKAFTGLFSDGAHAVTTLIAGAEHSRPRVRAACVALMDHLADERCCTSLERALHDASPLVRRHAVHAIGCQRCKGRPLSIDIVGALIERVLYDSNSRVRRVAVHQLGLQPRDGRVIEVLTHVIADRTDAGLVSRAKHALSLHRATAEPNDAMTMAKKPTKPVLLSGGNPQIAKGDGDGPVQAYLAAMPGWKRDLGRRLDRLIVKTVPGVRKAVKWNSPLYGIEGSGWFLGYHCFTKYVKVSFFKGASLTPMPPGTSKQKNVRYLDIYETTDLDAHPLAEWIRQASELPGWTP
jgi:hypothetical protein